jgi:uncharacterized membrane protein YeaQ/YmgE (transglycosylase-associated protein family)
MSANVARNSPLSVSGKAIRSGGTWVGRLVWGSNYVAGWILSVLGAMLLLLIYRMIAGKRS